MQSDWRTIDSVPKDGTWVLLWLTPLPWQATYEPRGYDVGRWHDHNGDGGCLLHPRTGIPTHWQALPSQPEKPPLEHNWRPISTAPKDGTVVCVWGKALGFDEPSWYKAYFGGDYEGDERPYWHWTAPGYVNCIQATHWQPAPEPPERE